MGGYLRIYNNLGHMHQRYNEYDLYAEDPVPGVFSEGSVYLGVLRQEEEIWLYSCTFKKDLAGPYLHTFDEALFFVHSLWLDHLKEVAYDQFRK